MRIQRGYKNPSGAVAFLTWVDPAVRDYVRVRAAQLGETVSEFVARLVRQEAASQSTAPVEVPAAVALPGVDERVMREDLAINDRGSGWTVKRTPIEPQPTGSAPPAGALPDVYTPPEPVYVPEIKIRLRSKEEREAIQAQRDAEQAKWREEHRAKLEANRARTRAQVAKRKAAKTPDKAEEIDPHDPTVQRTPESAAERSKYIPASWAQRT